MFDDPEWIKEHFEKEEFLEFLYEEGGYRSCASYCDIYCDKDSLEDLKLVYSISFNNSNTVSSDDLEKFISILKKYKTFTTKVIDKFFKI